MSDVLTGLALALWVVLTIRALKRLETPLPPDEDHDPTRW